MGIIEKQGNGEVCRGIKTDVLTVPTMKTLEK